MNEQEAIELFTKWYVEPIKILGKLPDGNGGFVAFMAGLALYERLIKAKLILQHQPEDLEVVQQEMAKDLHLSDGQRRVFWKMFRNGLLHQGMPLVGNTGFVLNDSYSGYPEFKLHKNTEIICINPWKFTDRVLNEFLSNPKLITASENNPLASILPANNTQPNTDNLTDFTQTMLPPVDDPAQAIRPAGMTNNTRSYDGLGSGGTVSPNLYSQHNETPLHVEPPSTDQVDSLSLNQFAQSRSMTQDELMAFAANPDVQSETNEARADLDADELADNE